MWTKTNILKKNFSKLDEAVEKEQFPSSLMVKIRRIYDGKEISFEQSYNDSCPTDVDIEDDHSIPKFRDNSDLQSTPPSPTTQRECSPASRIRQIDTINRKRFLRDYQKFRLSRLNFD